MLVIGLTGGIGSGKSMVCERFAEWGVPVIDADIIAREMVQPGKPALEAVTQAFGAEYLTSDGGLDRAKMRQRIFDDATARTRLENILHPLIRREIEQRLSTLRAPYVILCVPLLLEKDYRGIVHRVLVVDTPETVQLQRVCERDHIDRAKAELILQSQMPRAQRLKQADDIIDNSAAASDTYAQVDRLHKKYESLAQTS